MRRTGLKLRWMRKRNCFGKDQVFHPTARGMGKRTQLDQVGAGKGAGRGSEAAKGVAREGGINFRDGEREVKLEMDLERCQEVDNSLEDDYKCAGDVLLRLV